MLLVCMFTTCHCYCYVWYVFCFVLFLCSVGVTLSLPPQVVAVLSAITVLLALLLLSRVLLEVSPTTLLLKCATLAQRVTTVSMEFTPYLVQQVSSVILGSKTSSLKKNHCGSCSKEVPSEEIH